MRIELYYSYIENAHFSLFDRVWEGLPPTRRAALTQRRNPHESVAVTALLHEAVAGWESGDAPLFEGIGFCVVPEATLTTAFSHWESGEDGRPFPRGLLTANGRVWVSVAHSGGHLLVAVADRPVGADVQALAVPALSTARFTRLDARMRHPNEAPAATPWQTATRWAAKEALVKRSGEGLRRPFCTVDTTAEDVIIRRCRDCVIAVAVSR